MRRVWIGLAVVAVLGVAFLFLRPMSLCIEGKPRNVLLVTIDTLRADRVGAYGHSSAQTPHLDRLAASGLRFERATTVPILRIADSVSWRPVEERNLS